MKLKRVLTVLTAIVAVGSAFAGKVNAKQLLVNEGWYRNADGTDTLTEDTVANECLGGSNSPCAYFFTQGATEGSPVFFPIIS